MGWSISEVVPTVLGFSQATVAIYMNYRLPSMVTADAHRIIGDWQGL